MDAEAFYDGFADSYHLAYADWQASMDRQGVQLDRILQGHVPGARRVLDVACGVGTQSLALAALGYDVTASDISPASVARARQEADARGLDIEFAAADMLDAVDVHGSGFDAVLACDNAVPHLLTDDAIRAAFRAMRACLRPGGACVVSVRDYAREPREGVQFRPQGVRDSGGVRTIVYQVWEFEGPIYTLSLYLTEDDGGDECRTRVLRTRYYAVVMARLVELMREAGLEDIERLDGAYFQPVLVGIRGE